MLDQLDEIRNLSVANKKLQDEVDELSRNLELSIQVSDRKLWDLF